MRPDSVATSQLTYRYAANSALRFPDWSVPAGQSWAVLGPSGSGKTTLIQLLAGLRTPTTGTVCIAGTGLRELTERQRDRFRGRQLGIVFQTFHLLPALTVLDNLLLAPYLAHLPQEPRRARELLRRLGLAGLERRYPHALSQGQAQRVALARALMNRPAVILADEPTSALDDAACEGMLGLLVDEAAACEASLVVATHDRRVQRHLAHTLELQP